MEKKLSRLEKEKITRRESIITAAETLFLKNGFDNVSMDNVAFDSEFTKSTIYKYFPSKEDLYFSVALKCYKKLFSYFQESLKYGKNGYEKIYSSLMSNYKFYQENPENFKIISSIGYIKSKGEITQNNLLEWRNLDCQFFSEVIQLIEDGKKDESIKANLDSKNTTYSLIFIITGFFNLFAETGNNYINSISVSEKIFIIHSLDLIANIIKRKD
jgi:AcrR family transcriptional regulator